MAGAEKEKLLGSVGLAELIRRVKAAIEAAGAPPDRVTIDENDEGELEAVMDQEGGVTSYATHLADIVTADEVTITKSEENVVGLKPGGIQSGHLSDGCVTTDKIASKAVTSDKLADGSVETRVIADGAVTPEKISDLAELRGEMGLGNTLGALPVSSGGTGVTTLEELIALVASTQATLCTLPTGTTNGGFKANAPSGLMSDYRFVQLTGGKYAFFISPLVLVSDISVGNEIAFLYSSSISNDSFDITYVDQSSFVFKNVDVSGYGVVAVWYK